MGSGERIVVVDDNELVLAMVTRALEKAGYVVSSATSGMTMRNLLFTVQPDLIVLDVGLPDMDGRDLLAALKKDPKTRAIPVLVWSGGRDESDRRIALDQEMATCGNCPGEHQIQGTGVDMNEDGRACVLDGDPVKCPCGKNHVQASPDAGCSAG